MHREILPIENLSTWARLNNVSFRRAEVVPLPGSRGSGLVATTHKNSDDLVLLKVPKDLILSLENVWMYAKSDKHLKEVLETVGEYARVFYLVLCSYLWVDSRVDLSMLDSSRSHFDISTTANYEQCFGRDDWGVKPIN